MDGVNDLVERWLEEYEDHEGNVWYHAGYAEDCADDLIRLSNEAWHPVSEPPTVLGGESAGWVMIWTPENLVHMDLYENIFDETYKDCFWARIKDVVLLPENNNG